MLKKTIQLRCDCGRMPAEIIARDRAELQKTFTCECGKKFQYLDGFIKFYFYGWDHEIAQYIAISDYMEFGHVNVEVGIGKILKLKEGVKKIHHFSAIPQGEKFIIIGEYRFPLVEKNILKSENKLDTIWISPSVAPDVSEDNRAKLGETIKIGYAIYADKAIPTSPAWSIIFKIARELMIDERWRAALLEIASAFEVFIADFCQKNYQFSPIARRPELIQYIQKLMIKKGYIKTESKNPEWKGLKSDMSDYLKEWHDKVKEKRIGVFHRGEPICNTETREAYQAVFNAIKEIELESIFDLMPDTVSHHFVV